MPTPKQDAEELMNSLLPFAKETLGRHGEFYPYGGYMADDGKITNVGGQIEGTDHPESQLIIDLLNKRFQEKARASQLRATAVIFDVRITPPGSQEKTDAIQICLDHRDGLSVEVLFPYKITRGELFFGATFAQQGGSKIFARSNSN